MPLNFKEFQSAKLEVHLYQNTYLFLHWSHLNTKTKADIAKLPSSSGDEGATETYCIKITNFEFER